MGLVKIGTKIYSGFAMQPQFCFELYCLLQKYYSFGPEYFFEIASMNWSICKEKLKNLSGNNVRLRTYIFSLRILLHQNFTAP